MAIDVENIFKEYFGDDNSHLNQPLEYGYEDYGEHLLLYVQSKGDGFFGNELYELTFLKVNKATGEVQRINLDKSFTSYRESYDYFVGIDSDLFNESLVFGEMKKIEV